MVAESVLATWIAEYCRATGESVSADSLARFLVDKEYTEIVAQNPGENFATSLMAACTIFGRHLSEGDLVLSPTPSGNPRAEQGGVIVLGTHDMFPVQDAFVRLARRLI